MQSVVRGRSLEKIATRDRAMTYGGSGNNPDQFRMSGRNSAGRLCADRQRGIRTARRKRLDLRLLARAARGSIGGDYKRTTMRMAQLYGPLKARRCITPLQRLGARCEREREPTLRGSFLSRPPRKGSNKHRCLFNFANVGIARFYSPLQQMELHGYATLEII